MGRIVTPNDDRLGFGQAASLSGLRPSEPLRMVRPARGPPDRSGGYTCAMANPEALSLNRPPQ